MNKLDDDIRRVLTEGETPYDLEREEGFFCQVADLYRGKMRWMAILVTIESVVFTVLMVLAIVEFFEAGDTRWQIFYATGVLVLALMLLLVKLWSWMQMHRNAVLREIKRLELRILELTNERKD